MFRQRLTWVLALFAIVVVLAALLAAASLAVTERQVLRGRVASDIATGFIQISAQKQRLRTWVAQVQSGASAGASVGDTAPAELLSAMQGTLQRLKVLNDQAFELANGGQARQEFLRRSQTLAELDKSIAALGRMVADARPIDSIDPSSPATQERAALSQAYDMADDREMRMLVVDNIARETAAVERERAGADATLARVRWWWLGAAALLAAATLAAALYFGRALRYPLQQLSEGASALQAGMLGHRIELLGKDEFAAVARSVNALAAELEQHRAREQAQRQKLEDLVAARTADLGQALASLRQADAQRSRLFADISHELRTPTTVIRGEAEISLRGVDKPAAEYRDALGRIVATARQLGAVIDDLLAMARSDMDALSLVREQVDMDELAGDVLSQASALAVRQGVLLGPTPERTGRHLVAGDPLRLRQLLGILLDNATRYSLPGGLVQMSVRTVLNSTGEPEAVQIAVTDQGIGIPAHELARVFERHFRGAAARRHCHDGSGLGLSIALSLAQAHAGELHLDSQEGTRAVLTLPIVSARIRLEAAA